MTGGPSYGADGAITYNFGEISDVSAAIGTFVGAMDGSLQELYQEFNKLFAADWQGSAGQACDEARQKWDQGATEIKQALHQVGLKLGASVDRMIQVEHAIEARM